MTNKKLSPREQEVYDYVVQGLTRDEIMDKMCLESSTVFNHMKRITKKFKIPKRYQVREALLRHHLREAYQCATSE